MQIAFAPLLLVVGCFSTEAGSLERVALGQGYESRMKVRGGAYSRLDSESIVLIESSWTFSGGIFQQGGDTTKSKAPFRFLADVIELSEDSNTSVSEAESPGQVPKYIPPRSIEVATIFRVERSSRIR